MRLFVPSLTYLPATGRAPTPTPLTPQNKRLVTPDTDTQSERTKTPTNGPVIMATIPAATLDGRQILHKSFCPGLGEESFSEEVGPRVGGGPLCTPDVTSTPSFLQFPLEVPKCWLLQKGLPRLWGTQRPGAQEGNETLSELVSVLSFIYVVERVFPKHPV